MICDSIDYWKKYNRKPFDYKDPQPSQIYAILFFSGKRALFIRKDLTVINSFETRKAKQLLSNAIDRHWRTEILSNTKLGGRPEGHPKEADELHYIEVNKP